MARARSALAVPRLVSRPKSTRARASTSPEIVIIGVLVRSSAEFAIAIVARNKPSLARSDKRILRRGLSCAAITLTMRNKTPLFVCLLLVAACDSGLKRDAPQPSSKASTEPPASAQARSATTPTRGNGRLQWTAGAAQLSAELVNAKGELVVRITASDGRAFDVYSPGIEGSPELRVVGSDLVFQSDEVVGRVPEAGAIYAFEAVLVRWDPAQQKPVVAERWTCDEADQGRECSQPSWLSGAAAATDAPATGMAPTDEQARGLAEQLIRAGARGEKKALAKLFTKKVVVAGGANGLAEPATCPKDTPTVDLSRTKAVDCIGGLLSQVPASAMTAVTVESVGSSPDFTLPASEKSRIVHIKNESEGIDIELVVELAQGVPLVVATRVFIDKE